MAGEKLQNPTARLFYRSANERQSDREGLGRAHQEAEADQAMKFYCNETIEDLADQRLLELQRELGRWRSEAFSADGVRADDHVFLERTRYSLDAPAVPCCREPGIDPPHTGLELSSY